MSYKSSQQVWVKHLPGALFVMALAFTFFNTIQWSAAVDSAQWPYGTSITTLFAYLVSHVLEVKVAIFVSTIAAIVLLIMGAMKVRPILKSAFSPSYKWDTIMVITLFIGIFVALPLLGWWAFADKVVTNPTSTSTPCCPPLSGRSTSPAKPMQLHSLPKHARAPLMQSNRTCSIRRNPALRNKSPRRRSHKRPASSCERRAVWHHSPAQDRDP